jgi:hypothetical protein
MEEKRLVTIVVGLCILSVLIIGMSKSGSEWLKEQWYHIIYAWIFAIIAGVLIHYAFMKISPKPKVAQPTILLKPRDTLAKLILPNGNEIKITDDEKIFGREDFVGAVSADESLFIGKKHFKIFRLEDEAYIEDLDTKNGTKINGEEIKGAGRRELFDGDEIMVANVLEIKYME